jgi:hypothetical protein
MEGLSSLKIVGVSPVFAEGKELESEKASRSTVSQNDILKSGSCGISVFDESVDIHILKSLTPTMSKDKLNPRYFVSHQIMSKLGGVASAEGCRWS